MQNLAWILTSACLDRTDPKRLTRTKCTYFGQLLTTVLLEGTERETEAANCTMQPVDPSLDSSSTSVLQGYGQDVQLGMDILSELTPSKNPVRVLLLCFIVQEHVQESSAEQFLSQDQTAPSESAIFAIPLALFDTMLSSKRDLMKFQDNQSPEIIICYKNAFVSVLIKTLLYYLFYFQVAMEGKI